MALKKLAWWGSHRVAAGSFDIRGWRVQDEAGVDLGVVADLIFDDGAGLARYASLDIADEKLLVPIGSLTLRPSARIAVLIDARPGPALAQEVRADDHDQA